MPEVNKTIEGLRGFIANESNPERELVEDALDLLVASQVREKRMFEVLTLLSKPNYYKTDFEDIALLKGEVADMARRGLGVDSHK